MSTVLERPRQKKFTQSAKLINLRDRMFHKKNLIQAGKTPFDVISNDVQSEVQIKLRYYPALAGYPTRYAIPIVIVPPLAVNMLIYDLFENRSFVRFLLEQGFSVYMLDWGKPTRKQSHYDFERYVLNFMPKLFTTIRAHSGQKKLSLHGWSLAGIFSLLYAAATKDPDIQNMIILGTPVDAHKSGTIGAQVRRISRGMNWLEKRTGLHPRNLPYRALHTNGWANTLGYALLDIKGTLKSHLSLLKNLDNRESVKSHATNGAFLNHMVAYPGHINKDMLIGVWLENKLARGEYEMGKKTIFLKDVTQSLLIGAGRDDSIVTAAATKPLTTLVGSTDVTFLALPGGHVSMIASKAARIEAWPELTTWLAVRSNKLRNKEH
jgi:polyhydroxyalkanoate synthase